jgi:RNA polymerase sigma-70 factor (ECF subfamily)
MEKKTLTRKQPLPSSFLLTPKRQRLMTRMIPLSGRNEADLVSRCRRGDAAAQRAVYHQYERVLYGICLRYADSRDDALDLLQDSFVRIFRSLEGFRGEGSFEGWMRRITVRLCIEYCRKRARFLRVDLKHAQEVAIESDIWSSVSRDEILRLISQMPPGYRMVFNLYAVEGYGHQEIADMLGISEGASKSQLSRARRYLQQRLLRFGEADSFEPSNGTHD